MFSKLSHVQDPKEQRTEMGFAFGIPCLMDLMPPTNFNFKNQFSLIDKKCALSGIIFVNHMISKEASRISDGTLEILIEEVRDANQTVIDYFNSQFHKPKENASDQKKAESINGTNILSNSKKIELNDDYVSFLTRNGWVSYQEVFKLCRSYFIEKGKPQNLTFDEFDKVSKEIVNEPTINAAFGKLENTIKSVYILNTFANVLKHVNDLKELTIKALCVFTRTDKDCNEIPRVWRAHPFSNVRDSDSSSKSNPIEQKTKAIVTCCIINGILPVIEAILNRSQITLGHRVMMFNSKQFKYSIKNLIELLGDTKLVAQIEKGEKKSHKKKSAIEFDLTNMEPMALLEKLFKRQKRIHHLNPRKLISHQQRFYLSSAITLMYEYGILEAELVKLNHMNLGTIDYENLTLDGVKYRKVVLHGVLAAESERFDHFSRIWLDKIVMTNTAPINSNQNKKLHSNVNTPPHICEKQKSLFEQLCMVAPDQPGCQTQLDENVTLFGLSWDVFSVGALGTKTTTRILNECLCSSENIKDRTVHTLLFE